MFDKNKKNNEQNQENKQIKPEVKEENNKPKPEEETQESKMAKKIIDLETALNLKDKEIKDRDAIIQKFKDEKQAFEEEYKALALDLQNKANDFINKKLQEGEVKFKKDVEFAKKYAIKDQALELIDIISKFEQAVNFKPADPNIANWLKGFQMYLTMFNNLLNDLHIERIVPVVGQEFDPNFMECFPETIKDHTKKDNTIYEIIHTGYKLYDQLLKPALVKVVKNN